MELMFIRTHWNRLGSNLGVLGLWSAQSDVLSMIEFDIYFLFWRTVYDNSLLRNDQRWLRLWSWLGVNYSLLWYLTFWNCSLDYSLHNFCWTLSLSDLSLDNSFERQFDSSCIELFQVEYLVGMRSEYFLNLK